MTGKNYATTPPPTECARFLEITENLRYYPPPLPNVVGCKQFAFAIRAKLGLTPQMDVGPYAASIHKPSNNAALALETLVSQMKNSEQV